MYEDLNVGIIQMDCVLGDKEENINIALTNAKIAINNGANLLMLPEMFNTGYELSYLDSKIFSLAENSDNCPTVCALRDFAKENKVDICFTIPYYHTTPNGKPNISMFYVDYTGEIIAIQDKNHLFGDEKIYFSLGNDYPVFNTRFGPIGMMVCYDANFPEPARILTLKGAKIILCTAAWRVQDIRLFDMIMPQRAAENIVYLLACNRYGGDNGRYNPGHSQICSPIGTILQYSGEFECVLYGTINASDIDDIRKEIPYLEDLREAEYPNISTNN